MIWVRLISFTKGWSGANFKDESVSLNSGKNIYWEKNTIVFQTGSDIR